MHTYGTYSLIINVNVFDKILVKAGLEKKPIILIVLLKQNNRRKNRFINHLYIDVKIPITLFDLHKTLVRLVHLIED